MKDPNVTKKLATCGKLSDVNVSEYDAIFYVGGKVQVPRLGVSPVPIIGSPMDVLQGMDR